MLTWSDDAVTGKGAARLWDVTNPEPIQTFQHDHGVYSAQFSRDESRVLTWTGERFSRGEDRVTEAGEQLFNMGAALLWDVTKPEPLQTFKHDSDVIGAQFSRDESRIVTWSYDKTARLWDVTKPDPIQTFKHDSEVNGAQFSRDESRMVTWSYDNARLWDVTKPTPLQTFQRNSFVNDVQFRRDESRVLGVSHNGVRIWDNSDPLVMLSPSERILELEVRSGATLDEQLNLRTLSLDEWQDKVQSPEYRAIEKKLPARSTKPALQTPQSNRQSTVETPRSSSK